MFKQLIILSFLLTSIQANAEEVEYIVTGKELTKENSFLIYNGHPGDFLVETYWKADWAALWGTIWNKATIHELGPSHCMQVHNRHLGSITIRRDSDLNPLVHTRLMGAICKKSECPEGDILIGYKTDDDGEKVPAHPFSICEKLNE